MSKYTMELREVISAFGEEEVKSWFMDYNPADILTAEEMAVINERGVWSKDKLADRIITHFYTREIGTDAIGQFMMFVKDKLSEVMESYLPVIYSASLKFNPLDNVNISETFTSTTGANTQTTSSGSTSGLGVNSDTPQGQISKSQILEGRFASSTGANESETSSTGNTTSDGKEDSVRTTKGTSNVSSSEMLKQYRDVIRAVNTEIVYELEPLFMGIY